MTNFLYFPQYFATVGLMFYWNSSTLVLFARWRHYRHLNRGLCSPSTSSLYWCNIFYFYSLDFWTNKIIKPCSRLTVVRGQPQPGAHSKTPKNPCDHDLWHMTLKFNRVLEVVEVHVRAKFHEAKCGGSWFIYRAYKHFCPISQWWKIRKSGPVTLTFDAWPWKSIGFVRLSRYMFVENFTKLRAAVCELSCPRQKKLRQK